VDADNLIRRRLRISDPYAAKEVAEGLRRLFRSDDELLKREASGLPIVAPPPIRAVAATEGPSSAELEQARDDVERDLKSLISNSQLKDIEPELSGWGQAVRAISADGLSAARLALDPRARDRAFSARRQLGGYARLARLVGALTCHHNQGYRRLAQSLDEVANLILVMMGEALARIGFSGGRFLPQAPASELQARRDAATAALRNLTGSTQEAYGAGDWPWGLHGLREALQLLDTSGHSDLRALLEENTLARLMDDLLDRAASLNTSGLRALGATSTIAIQQLNRLVQIIDDRVSPGSPPLTALIEAIRLFADAFQSSGSGYRLLFVARPPVVFYGLYGIGGPDVATQHLLDVVVQRGRLAELLDCYLGCNCCEEPAICQVLLDKLLHDTDRAIDLYVLGADPQGDGEPEWRAASYGLVIEAFLRTQSGRCLGTACLPTLGALRPTLEAIRDEIVVVPTLPDRPLPIGSPLGLTGAEQRQRREIMRDEICLQRRADARLGGLLATMAPSCVRANEVLRQIDVLLGQAIGLLGLPQGTECPVREVTLPPTVAQSVQIFDDIRRTPVWQAVVRP
jgi:hypothetical protein